MTVIRGRWHLSGRVLVGVELLLLLLRMMTVEESRHGEM